MQYYSVGGFAREWYTAGHSEKSEPDAATRIGSLYPTDTDPGVLFGVSDQHLPGICMRE